MEFFRSFILVLRFNFWQNSAKFIFVLGGNVPLSAKTITEYFLALKHCQIMKAIIIVRNRVFGFDYFTRFYEISKSKDLEDPFNSWKVHNYEYRVAVGLVNGHIVKRGSEYIELDLSVMQVIAQKDQSSVRYIEVPVAQNNNEIFHILSNGSADIAVIPGLRIDLNPFMRFVSNYDNADTT